MSEPKVRINEVGDAVCEHGTAMDVHCCNCHSGFIFDMDHECPPPPCYQFTREDYIRAERATRWTAGPKVAELLHEAAKHAPSALSTPQETCGVRGRPSAGDQDAVLTCELPVGHEGYHRSGRISWLGYHPTPQETER
jgi:hypothetical protein